MRPGPGERSVFRDVLRRQWDARRRRSPHVGHPTFIDGLRLTNVLERHGGCVNALAWNDDATLLLSGSDDLCVCVDHGRGLPVAVPCIPATSTTSSATSSSRTAAARDASPPRATVTFASSTSNAASRPTHPEGEDGGSPTRTTTHPPRVPSFATKRGKPSPHGEYRHGHESALRPRRPQRLPRHPSRRPSASSTCERPSREARIAPSSSISASRVPPRTSLSTRRTRVSSPSDVTIRSFACSMSDTR